MSEGPQRKRYDTNPLDPALAERQTDPVDTEAPTWPMPPQPTGYMPPQSFVEPPPGPVEPRPNAHLGFTPNFAAMVCYMPFVGLIPAILLTQSEPAESRFIRFHARQALFAHIAFWAGTIAFSIARAAAPTIASLVLAIPQLLFFVASMAGLVFMMIQSYRFKTVKIPIIGDQVE